MRHAWPLAIGFSVTAHAALLVVSVHTLLTPARVDVASGDSGTSCIRVGLVADPVMTAPQTEPPAEPQVEAARELRADVITLESPREVTDRPSRPQAEAENTVPPVEQAAVTPRDQKAPTSTDAAPGVAARPLAHLNRPPSYPAIARRMGWEGTVVLEVEVGANGRISDVDVAASSGHTVLDRAAADVVHSWRFKPARHHGTPVACHVRLPIKFQLVSP